MIKNILIPEKIGNYYIFPKRLVGFDIDKTHVTATQLYLSGDTVTIERCVDEKLEIGAELTHDEKVVKAIRNIVNVLDPFDEVYTSISSSHVIFKSLKLPFTSYNKIKGIVSYEVEPLLPFSANEALIDFVITKKIPKENSSEVMVVAAQASVLEQHISLFEQAGIMPTKVVVDILSLYSLYKNIPAYKDLKGSVILVDIGFNTSRVAYIHDGHLAFVRTISKGIFSQAKELARLHSISQTEAAEVLMRFGMEKPDDAQYKKNMDQVASVFWSDVKFTLQSFSSQMEEDIDIERALILGQGAKIAGIVAFATKFLGIESQLFKVDSLIDKKNVKIKNSLSIPSSNIISLGVALPSNITDQFNLYKIGSGIKNTQLLNKQLIVAAVFVFVILSLLFVHGYIQKGKLSREIEASEQEAIDVLKEKFKVSKDDETLDEVVDTAKKEVQQKENQFAFVGKDRFSFLKYLHAFFNVIDKKGLGLEVDRLTISPEERTMEFDAEVKDDRALRELEKSLRENKMFTLEKSPQDKKFKMIIKLLKNS